MKVKTFALIAAMLFLIALIAIVQLSQYIRPETSTITVTEGPDNNYSASMTPDQMPEVVIPDVNDSSLEYGPIKLTEKSNDIVKITTTPTPAPISPTPTPEPRPTAMVPMKPMEPWKPATPMEPW